MKKFLAALALLSLLFAAPVAATELALYSQVKANGAGVTAAKGAIFYTTDGSGTIRQLLPPVNGTYCVSWTSQVPSWSTCSGGGGVTSLNSLTGALSLVAGTNITVTPSGSNITIEARRSGGVADRPPGLRPRPRNSFPR